MINIWCVCVGDKYSHSRVDALHGMVDKNLDQEYKFNCLTESPHPGWWAKISLHDKAKPGKNLYFDLDTVIVRDLSPLVEYCGSVLSMPKNWGASGHGGFQSSVMAWRGEMGIISRRFKPECIGPVEGTPGCMNHGTYIDEGKRFWGDQEWLTWKYGSAITEIQPGLVVSYKYHCQNTLPESAIAVTFHGKPDYWEVDRDWIKKAL